MSWSIELPVAADFVGRSLSERYGVDFHASDRVRLTLLPLPGLVFENVRLTSARSEGAALAEFDEFAIQLSVSPLLAGRAEPVAIAAKGGMIALPASDDDRRWAPATGRFLASLATGKSTHPQRVILNQVAVTGRHLFEDAALRVGAVDLIATWPSWSGSVDVDGSFDVDGGRAQLAITSLAPAALAGAAASPFRIRASWPTGSLEASGTAELGKSIALAGSVRAESRSLPATLAAFGGSIALLPLFGQVGVDAHFQLSGKDLRFPDLTVRLGETLFDGAATVEFAKPRPALRATLAADSLELAPLLAEFRRLSGLDRETWARLPLDLTPLTGGDLDLRLSGSSARLGAIPVEDVAASISVRENRIEATLGPATVRGGTVKGRVVLTSGRDGAETEIKAQTSFDGIDVASLQVDLGTEILVNGALQGSAAFEAKGRDAASLVQRLKGRASFTTGMGALVGLDLGNALQHEGRIPRGALARRNGRTPFERASLTLTISDGIGEMSEAGLSSRSLFTTLSGRIRFEERRMDLLATVLPRTSTASTELTSFPTLRYDIAGPWTNLSVMTLSGHGGAADQNGHQTQGPSR